MSDHSLRDYLEHMGACSDGLTFVDETNAQSLGYLFSQMSDEGGADNGGELDFVGWAITVLCNKIPRSCETGMEVRRLTCLYVQTVLKHLNDDPDEKSEEFQEDINDLGRWADITVCDSIDYADRVRQDLETITCYIEGSHAVKKALVELTNEFDRVWKLVTDWFDQNDPPNIEGEIVPVLESLEACSSSMNFFRGYSDVGEAYAALDPERANHRQWWFWIVGSLCRKMRSDGADVFIRVLEQLHRHNAENGKIFSTARDIGELIGRVRTEDKVSSNVDSDFYNLRTDFDYDLRAVMEATREELISLWNDYKEQEGL